MKSKSPILRWNFDRYLFTCRKHIEKVCGTLSKVPQIQITFTSNYNNSVTVIKNYRKTIQPNSDRM